MTTETIDAVLDFLRRQLRKSIALDLTGGAPELNPQFRRLVVAARARGTARHRPLQPDHPRGARPGGPGGRSSPRIASRLVASLPCYLEDNVDRQRGKGVFEASLRALRRLNALGYGTGRRRTRR
jgi:hypothetical protein